MPTTYYDTLQVAQNADPAVIRASYRALSQQYHPDRNPNDLERANRYMKRINEAYEVLSDPKRRADYDELLASVRSDQAAREPQGRYSDAPTPERPTSKQGSEADPLADRFKADGRSRFENVDLNQSSKRAAFPGWRTSHRIGDFGFGLLFVGPLVALALAGMFAESGGGFIAFLVVCMPLAGYLWMRAGDSRRKPSIEQPTAVAAKQVQFGLGTLVLLGAVGAFITARRFPGASAFAGHDALSLLLEPFFWGQLVIALVAIEGAVLIPYGIALLISRSKQVARISGAVLASLLFLAFWFGAEAQKESREASAPATQAASRTAVAAPRSVAPDLRRAAYDAEVRRLEQEYPVLNPDSSAHNEVLTTQVLERARVLVSSGAEPANAIREAATKLLSRPSTATPARAAPAMPSSKKPDALENCVYKAVMSDADYRACGVAGYRKMTPV